MELQVGVKIFLKNNDNKYLLVKRSETKYPNANGRWDIVGGRINPGTALLENLKREVREETGLEIIGEPQLICAQDIMRSDDRHVVRLSYVGNTDGAPQLDTEENTAYEWLSAKEIAAHNDLDAYVKEIIDKNLIS